MGSMRQSVSIFGVSFSGLQEERRNASPRTAERMNRLRGI